MNKKFNNTIVETNGVRTVAGGGTGTTTLGSLRDSLQVLPLSGGTLTGNTKINANLTVYGDISATGNSYFSNTVYSTTSALSVVNIGNIGPALYVANNGTGDLASFYDLDADPAIEVLHIGGHNGDYPNVGIKTSTPNKTLTVNGEISASNTIWTSDGNSDLWNTAYKNQTSFLPLSGGTLTGKLNLSSTAIKAGLNIGQSVSLATPYEIGDLWRNSSGRISYALSTNTVATVAELERANSYTQSQTITNNNNISPALRITQTGLANALLIDDDTHPDSTPFVIDNLGSVGIGLSSLSGIDAKLTVIGNVSATGLLYGNGSQLTGIVAGDTVATTLVRSNSSNWDSAYLNQTNLLPLSGGTLTGKLTTWYSPTEAGLNIGANTIPTNPVDGDIWLEGNKIKYKENNTVRAAAKENGVNIFSTYQSIFDNTSNPTLSTNQSGSGGGISILNQGDGVGLKITSTGAGFALRVEDETSPDSNSFIVDSLGNVGIGLSSANAIAANKLTVVGNISATQDYFSGSNKSVFTPQTNTIGVSAVSNIVVVSVLPVTPDPSTLYIII
jgi:hypothetical protein